MIRIGFSTPKRWNPLSWALRVFTGAACSHCYFVYRDTDWDMDCVLEADVVGFRIIPLARFEALNNIVATVEPKVPIDDGVRAVARAYLGTPYSVGGLLGAAVVRVGRWFHRQWHNPLSSSRSVFCSEAVARALQVSKYPGAERLDPDVVSPQDVLGFLTGGAPS